MDLSRPAIVAQVINIGILFFLFRKFLSKPIIKVIEDRRQLIKKVENAEKIYEEKLQEGEEKKKELMEEGKNTKDKIIAEAGSLGQKRKDEIIVEAKQKANEIINNAKETSKNLEQDLTSNFEEGVKKTSFMVLKRLFGTDKQIKEEYLDKIMKDLK